VSTRLARSPVRESIWAVNLAERRTESSGSGYDSETSEAITATTEQSWQLEAYLGRKIALDAVDEVSISFLKPSLARKNGASQVIHAKTDGAQRRSLMDVL